MSIEIYFKNLCFMSSNSTIKPSKQQKSFIVPNVKAQLVAVLGHFTRIGETSTIRQSQGRPKSKYSNGVLIAIEANPARRTQRVSDELFTFMAAAKACRAVDLFFTLSKYCETFGSSF